MGQSTSSRTITQKLQSLFYSKIPKTLTPFLPCSYACLYLCYNWLVKLTPVQLTFMRYSRAVLSQSLPLTSFGTRKRVANFSVSVSAASNARRHFLTGSEIKKLSFRYIKEVKCKVFPCHSIHPITKWPHKELGAWISAWKFYRIESIELWFTILSLGFTIFSLADRKYCSTFSPERHKEVWKWCWTFKSWLGPVLLTISSAKMNYNQTRFNGVWM